MLLKGQNVQSNRLCHNGLFTDVTTNPNYDRIPTMGKYRLTFKDKPEFNPFNRDKTTRALEHDTKNADIAKESSNFIRAQILRQATTTLLSSANQSPFVALTLLGSVRR